MIRVFNLATVPVRTITTTQRSQIKPVSKPVPTYGCNEVFKSIFLSGLSVSCQRPTNSLLSTITVMFAVGSRFETAGNMGVTHFLRNASIMSAHGSSDFIRARYLQQEGAYLTCCSERHFIAYTLTAPSCNIADYKCALIDVSVRNAFPDWEMDHIRESVRADLSRRDPLEHIMDLIQKASFTYPLSNSVYCEEERVNSISGKDMSNFVSTYFKPGICCIGSTGVPIQELVKIADNIGRHTDKAVPCYVPGRFRGGYEFYDTGPGVTYIALAVQGAGLCNFKACLLHAILAAAIGHGNVTQGQHTLDRSIQKPLGILAEDHDCSTLLTAFNIAYCETGCFGLLVKTTSPMARCVGFRAAEFFYNIGSITPGQVCLGKKRLQLGVMLQESRVMNSSLNQALQPRNLPFENACDLCNVIAGISVQDVICLAQSIASKRCCQMSMAVLGDVESAPHDAELRCNNA